MRFSSSVYSEMKKKTLLLLSFSSQSLLWQVLKVDLVKEKTKLRNAAFLSAVAAAATAAAAAASSSPH